MTSFLNITPVWIRLLFSLLLLVCFACSREPAQRLPHDAYIWQRQWTAEVVAAVQQSSDLIRAWRVLAAESDAHGHLQPVILDWAAIERSGRMVVPVIRIEGQLANWDKDVLREEVRAILSRWHAQRIAIAGIEIDHDCGTARLPAYAQFLATLRVQLADARPLSITALPTWLSSSDLNSVLTQVDEVILQVHAVQNPRADLFDAKLARQWVEILVRQSTTPFRVALPTYGSRVSWRPDGSLLAVESEAVLLTGGDDAVELMVSPQEVATLLRELERDPPPHLTGIVWFRLPTVADRRAWSLDTWRAVILGKPLHARINVLVQSSDTPGMNHLVLVNNGDVDAELPGRVELPTTCTLADGINGYALTHADSHLVLHRLQRGLLHSQHQQVIGWMRCAPEQGEIQVQP